MKFLTLLLCLSTIAPAQEVLAPRLITIKVPVQAYLRAKDEADLMRLLVEDFENSGKGIVDMALRRRIVVIARRLEREP